jgi:hypothetical protein
MSAQLMKILNFTKSDLPYNRIGELSPQQKETTNKNRRTTKLILLIIGIIVLVIAAVWTFLFLGQEEVSARVVAVSVGLLFFGLPGLILVYLGIRPIAKKIPVQTIKGKAKIARVEHTSRTSRYVRTEIHVAGKVFPIADEAFSELDDGAEYTLYIWKDTDHIFSLEKL